MPRRIILLLALIVVAITIAIFLWLAFFKPTPAKPPEAGLPINEELPAGFPVAGPAIPGLAPTQLPLATEMLSLSQTTQPSAAEIFAFARGGLTQIKTLIDGPVFEPALGSAGQEIIFWDPKDSRFWIVDSQAKRRLLSDKEFFNIEQAIFSPDKSKVLVEYPDGANIVYNFSNKQQTTLPNHWKDFSFSPDNNSLVFKSMGREMEMKFLAVAGIDGSGFEDLTTLGAADKRVFPLWSPQGGIVAMFTEDKALARQNLYFIGLNEEQYQSIAIPGFGFKPQWTNKGDRIVFEIYSGETGFRPNLWIVDASPGSIGANRTNLNVPTFIEKCALAADDRVLYCAVPRSLPEGAGLVPQIAENIADDFYKIDLDTGIKTLLAVTEEDYTIENFLVSKDEKYLFFKNKGDGRLYGMQLK